MIQSDKTGEIAEQIAHQILSFFSMEIFFDYIKKIMCSLDRNESKHN
jgi:hypothetical protein